MGRASRRRKEIKTRRKYQKIFQSYRKDPIKWIEDTIGSKLYWYQRLMSRLFYRDRNKVQYIDFTNGSRITTIPTKSEITRGNRANIISFYCDFCNKWHIEVPKSEMVIINSNYTICKPASEQLLKENSNE